MRCTWTVVALAALTSPAWADPRPVEGLSIDETSTPLIAAQRPIDVMVPLRLDRAAVPALVNSHVVYLNPCLPNGCTVTQGSTDSRTDTSDIGHGKITAYSYGTTSWQQVVSCVKQVMSPFNITVTDVDPGKVDHFEIMIGGSPANIGLPASVGGIADFPCQDPGVCSGYIPDALVFDFASVWNGNTTYICGTAAQEIAHAWTLDHTIDTHDPMTYNSYATPLGFHDAETCGSDCMYSCPSGTGTCNAFGVTCSGTGGSASHVCMGNNMAKQDELKTIAALFGPAGAQPPTVAITSPAAGSAQQSSFAIETTCTSPDGIQEVDMTFDGVPRASLKVAPYNFTAPAGLKDGPHHISILCGTNKQAIATAEMDVVVGQKCSTDSDCTVANYICFSGACIAGPNATGGLGATCTGNGDCMSGSCASDGSTMQCVLPCDPANDTCPSGFGCISAGAAGVCWHGADKSSGGGCSTGGDGASILLGLGFAAALVTRRKK